MSDSEKQCFAVFCVNTMIGYAILTWDELKAGKRAEEFFYNPSAITDHEICERAFCGSRLQHICIPDSVTRIADGAFAWCDELESVDLPFGLKEIGNEAFADCGSLSLIDIPECVERIGEYAFANCTKLLIVDLPDSVTALGKYAFASCTKLGQVRLSKNISVIEEGTFCGCFCLTIVKLAHTVSVIEPLSFFMCSCLFSIDFEGTKAKWESICKDDLWVKYASMMMIRCKDGELTMKNYNREGSPIAVIVENRKNDYKVYSIEDLLNLFPKCSNTVIGDGAFRRQPVYAVNLPKGITCIGKHAFSNCAPLCAVYIPDGIIDIGKGAFCECYNLKTIDIPGSVKKIDEGAFSKCYGLETVVLEEGVEKIGSTAFLQCFSLRYVKIPKSVKVIDTLAFYSCKDLSDIYYDGTIEEWAVIMKDAQWDGRTGEYLIHCKDGIVPDPD